MQSTDLRVLTLILTPEQVNKLSRRARKNRISCTKILAKGTVSNHFMQMLGIGSDRREMIKILLQKAEADSFLDTLSEELQLSKPGHGIVYMTEAIACAGAHGFPRKPMENTAAQEDNTMYQKITVIVDRGNADQVMEVARAAGVRGGTILHGRGSTGKEAQKIFGIEIEEEKELVVILTPASLTPTVFNAIAEKLDIDAPGKGIMYVEPMVETRGLAGAE